MMPSGSSLSSPVLTIVIVNWNGGEMLIRCLESLRAYGNPERYEVIVVDNDSHDGSREAAVRLFPEFQIINSGSNLGFGRANNLVRNDIESPLVLFLNPDTEVRAGALERAVAVMMDRPEVGALGCMMVDAEGGVQPLGIQWTMTPVTALLELAFITTATRRYLSRWIPTADPLESGFVDKLYGGCLLVRKEILDDAGWFDERYFMYAEDADLSRTIRARGWKLYYCAEAAVMHIGGGTTAAAPSGFSVLMKQESINKLIGKYQGSMAALLHRAAVFAGSTLRLGVTTAGWLCSMATRNSASSASWRAKRDNYKLMSRWALGMAKARIPGAAGTSR